MVGPDYPAIKRVWVKSVTNFRSPETGSTSAVIWPPKMHPVSDLDEFYVYFGARKIIYNFVVYHIFIWRHLEGVWKRSLNSVISFCLSEQTQVAVSIPSADYVLEEFIFSILNTSHLKCPCLLFLWPTRLMTNQTSLVNY